MTIPDDSDVRRSICVFCGSSRGANPAYSEAARNLGAILAAEGRRLVYGGGNVGLMGVVADAVLEAGGTVVGVIPQHLLDLEVGHRGVTELRVVHSMHERKEQMSTLADAFVLLTPRSRRPRSLPHRDLETAWESG